MSNHTPGTQSGLAQVALRAGVSAATVSRAFNAPQLLRRETLERVAAAAKALHYHPDGLARSLRASRTMVIGAVVPSLRHAYFAKSVQGIQSALAKQGYTLSLSTSEFSPDTELSAVTAMLRQGVDAVILVGKDHHPELMTLLESRNKPFILTWSYERSRASVGFDHHRAMQPVIDHLLDLGHREIVAIMAFLTVSDRERDRLRGIEDAFALRGLSFSADRVIYAGGSGLQDGRNALRAALARFPVTAVVCANDLLAAGAIMECGASGIRVPEQISITGYGDLDIAGAMNPPITTVRLQAEEMGQLAGNCLIARLAGHDLLDRIELPTEFVARASTGPVAEIAS